MNAADIVAQATDPTASAWVSANAGAGKTYLLTDRVTRLLNAGAKPERILCLTYTKAAAAEMAKRLFERLGEWALLPDDALAAALMSVGAATPDAEALRRARTLFAQALETPGGLKIQTIHSFCQHVLSRFPVEAGIAPRFTVLDERAAGEAMATARRNVLERAARGESPLAEAVATLAVRAADTRFADILDAAIAGGGKLRALLEKHGDEARFFAHLRKALSVAEGEDENAVLAQFCDKIGAERGDCERVAKWLLGGSVNDRKYGESLTRFVGRGMGAEFLPLLRAIFLTKDGPRKQIATKKLIDAEPQLFATFESLRDRFVAMEERRKAVVTATLTEALMTVSLAVLKTYDRLKRERAGLDYDDLVRHTLNLLDRQDAASWVLYKLDGGLEHILVDEAQDTSPEQWRIVAKLAEEFFAGKGAREGMRPRTLFAVGDEKQSIFSFQGADPVEFGNRRVEFKGRAEGAELPFADLRPAISRRSTRAVLEFVDTVFASEGAREGLTSSGDAIHHDPHRKETGRIELWPAVKAPDAPAHDLWDPVDQPAKDSSAVQLAESIAKRIAGWLNDGTMLPGSARAITPGDIMILVRRRNAFTEEMIRQLQMRGVAVAGADRMVLSEQIAIADLVALGRFALLPEDDLTLAALLKSPLVGLSEEHLFALAHGRREPLWNALVARKDEPNFAAAHEFLAAALSQADFVAPFEFYARALAKGLRKKLVARLGAEAADAIDEFLALALAHESAHPPSLESFLDWFAKGASEIKRDMDEGAGQIRVMTVHGAKGLEANIVIVPDTAQIPDHAARSGLLYTEDCVFFGVPKALETAPVTGAKNEARLREMREYRRLLYVALTRAREWLILCGYESKHGVKPESWYPHLEAAARGMGREEQDGDETLIAFGDTVTRGSAREAGKRGAEPTLPGFLSKPAPKEQAPRLLRPSEAAGMDEFPATSPLGENGKRFQRGLLVHALLARLPELPADQRETAALSYLTRSGLDAADAQALTKETFAILDHKLFAALFAQGSRAEVAVTAHLPELNARISGQIDRLAVTDDSVLIADFKTNRPPPESAEDTPALYRAQMALYRAALHKIYPGKRIDCALVWTDGARLMPLPPALLDAEIARIAKRLDAT